jgi:hypothetical protein
MATVAQLLAKYRTLDVQALAAEAARRHRDALVDLQKDQLWAGQNLAGGDLTPSILDDPYFRGNRRRAQGWSDYKDRQAQWAGNPAFPRRRAGTPNLIFSTGDVVWNPLRVVAEGDKLYLDTELSVANELEGKYGPVFGLNPTGRAYFVEHFFRRELFEAIHAHFSGA